MQDINNINESYLEDVSYSVYIEKKYQRDNPLQHPLPNSRTNINSNSWQDDYTVTNCQNCRSTFSLFTRKHHCRLCGKIYCYDCSKYRDIIPATVLSNYNNINIKSSWVDYLGSYMYDTNQSKHRVCINCHTLIDKVFQVKKTVEMFVIMKLDILDLKKAGRVCNLWLNAANYCLSKFREIQYKIPTELYSKLETDMLWNNIKYLQGHNKYIMHLIKTCNNDVDLEKIIKIIDEPFVLDCKTMMCSRNCANNLTSFDAINILDYSFKHVPYSKVFKELALAYLDKNCPDEEFKCYIPYLVYNIKYDSYNIIGQFLLNRCLKNLYLLSALYWEIQLYTDVPYLNLSKNLKHILSQDNYQPQFLKLLIGNKLVKHLESINHSIYVENKQYDDIKDEYNLSKESIVPLNIEVSVNRILLNKIKIKDSATKPIIIPCITDTGNTYKIMYKNEDVRKDQIIMNIIYLMESIVLKEEGVNLEVVRYNILPIDNRSGLIEIIDEAETVYYIQEKLKSNITNYIFENNEDSTVKSIRSKFIKSVAAYCVITYLLGIGDRHLDNIMITKDGRLFHVDFGYILGLDPVFNNPGIRITPNIIEAIGGLSSKYYVEFQELSTKIYNCLRRNIDIFMHLLLLLPKISDIGLTEEQIKNQVITRFMPGESNVNAKMHMVNQLERVNYTDQIKDWCHYYSKEKTMNSAINRLNSAISSLWYPIG
jgi:hypothetical protein